MTDDPNRKSLRQFQCRDYLWETFEQMSRDLECSVDYLINEAMRHYARAQGRIQQHTAPPGARQPAPMGAGPAPMQGGPRPMMGNGPQMPGGPPGRPMTNPPGANPAMQGRPMPPMAQQGYPPQQPQQRPMMPQQPQQPQGYPRMPQQQQQQQQGYPQQPARPTGPMAAPPGAMLFAIYEGQRYPVNKDEFFIGRSNKTCDLIVKDPNVSRRHARIVRHQGAFWMMDLGSTNGIEYQGGKIDRKLIAEGDVFKICDHEIVFTYQ